MRRRNVRTHAEWRGRLAEGGSDGPGTQTERTPHNKRPKINELAAATNKLRDSKRKFELFFFFFFVGGGVNNNGGGGVGVEQLG